MAIQLYSEQIMSGIKLKTFQVQHCFGFRDSGSIRMEEPSNLIYVLGRNSSGKSSLLQALYYLETPLVSEGHENFRNYNIREGEQARLVASFSLKPDSLSLETLMKVVTRKLSESPFNHPNDMASTHKQKLLSTLKEEISTIYGDVIETILAAGIVWVEKRGNGHYRFSTEPAFGDFDKRKVSVQSAMDKVFAGGQYNADGTMRPVKFTFEDVEDALFKQFPKIVFFEQEYPLTAKLPDQITLD